MTTAAALSLIPTSLFRPSSNFYLKKNFGGRDGFRVLAVFGEEGRGELMKNTWGTIFDVEHPGPRVLPSNGKHLDVNQALEVARMDIQYCDWRARQDLLTIMLLHEKVVEVLNPLAREFKSIGTMKKELAELQQELAEAHGKVHLSEARVAAALDKLAYVEALVNDKLLPDRTSSESTANRTSLTPSTSSTYADPMKTKSYRSSLNVSGPIQPYHPNLKNFWYPVAFSSDLKDDTMIVMELPVEHGLLLDNLLDLAHAPFTHTSTFAKGWSVPSLVNFLTPASGLQGYWDPYPIDMEFRPPCIVLSTIGISKPGKLEGQNTRQCSTHTERMTSPVVVAMSSRLHGASYGEKGVASNSGRAAENFGGRDGFRVLAVFGEEGRGELMKNTWGTIFDVEHPGPRVLPSNGKHLDVNQALEVARMDIQYCDWRARQDLLTIMLLHEKVVEVLNPLAREFKSIGTMKKELAELQQELAEAHGKVHLSEARVAAALDKLAYVEALVNDKLLPDRTSSESTANRTSLTPSTSSTYADPMKTKSYRSSLNVSGPIQPYHPNLKNFWYPVAFSSDLKDDTMIVMELPVEHGLLLDNLLDLAHAPFTHTSTFAKGWSVPSLVNFLTPASGLQGYWDPYPIDMEFRPPCIVLNEDLRLVVGQQERMIDGANIWNLPVSYDKLGVRYRLWRTAVERGAEHLPFTEQDK
ncbi:hypothetical protein COCNU_15G002220 [Cocos nucifera]|uniref:Chlorophyllide a oxygenase n=1 Tax=Cocos nucifera TaxID=13894 RepID=A0A8K0IXF5_COCNU|nr:hypothetical protein COCNU_15G002220 [Cocos nucifera]